jgi:hypothetical protein
MDGAPRGSPGLNRSVAPAPSWMSGCVQAEAQNHQRGKRTLVLGLPPQGAIGSRTNVEMSRQQLRHEAKLIWEEAILAYFRCRTFVATVYLVFRLIQ